MAIFDIDGAEKAIGYVFNDKMLLRQCFTHASFAHEHNQQHNEVLEFFGDAIMEFVVTEFLYKERYADEGKLTELRKNLVSKEPLLRIVKKMGLNEFLLLGRGACALKEDEKLFSSVYEALVAGIYLDGGIEQAKNFIKNTLIADYVAREKAEKKVKKQDAGAKTLLQEYVQKNGMGSISYQTLSKSGPDHSPEFRVAVLLNNGRLAEGKGKSKKLAEADAAEKALDKLKKQGGKR